MSSNQLSDEGKCEQVDGSPNTFYTMALRWETDKPSNI